MMCFGNFFCFTARSVWSSCYRICFQEKRRKAASSVGFKFFWLCWKSVGQCEWEALNKTWAKWKDFQKIFSNYNFLFDQWQSSWLFYFVIAPIRFTYRSINFFFDDRVDGIMDAQGFERSYTVNSSILLAIQPHLIHFHQLLLKPPKVQK